MRKVFLTFMSVCAAGALTAQPGVHMIGTEGFIKGNFVEIGIAGSGGYEGADCVNPITPVIPAGYHFRSGTQYFGFVANPTMSVGWSNFDGDYFTPGTPENGWGIEVGGNNGVKAANNCWPVFPSAGSDMPGSIVHSDYVNGCLSMTQAGNFTSGGYNIDYIVKYQLKEDDSYYTTTVSFINKGAATIDTLFYYRNLDPDNNQAKGGCGDFTTTNTIVANPNPACDKAMVTATQTGGCNSYFGLAAYGADYRVMYGGFSNRDGSDIWNGITTAGSSTPFVQTVGSVNTNDEGMALSYLMKNIAPGDTAKLKFVVILDASQADNAVNSLYHFLYAGGLGVAVPECSAHIDSLLSCPGKTLNITFTNGNSSSGYTWTWSPADGLNTTTGTSVVASPDHDILYTITGVPTVTTCYTSTVVGQIAVIMDTLQDVEFDVRMINASCGLPNGSLEVHNFTGGIGPVNSIQWSNGVTAALNEKIASGNYTVTVIDSFGCRVDSLIFLVADTVAYPVVIPPNVFTPNGDGKNDKMVVHGSMVDQYKITIYNRWGQVVYKSENINEAWDGKFNGNPVADGSYMYTIEYNNPCEDPPAQSRKGSVQVLR